MAAEKAVVVEKRLFGMPAEKGRWMFILLGFIINLCLGSVYAYSVFGGALQKGWGLDVLEKLLPYGIFLAFFAAVFPLSGQLLEKIGPKKQGIIGGIIVALGWITAHFATNWGMAVLTYGVIGGIGVGLCYSAPIATATRWFPDRKGLATGLTVAGFGGSPFISTYLGQILIKHYGVFDTFLYFGVAFLIVLLVCFWFMRFPEAGWKPAGWKPAAAAAAAAAVSYDRKEVVRTSTFWVLFACFTIGATAGLMAIGIWGDIKALTIIAIGFTAAVTQFVLAPFNAGGRPVFGFVTDKVGPRVAAMVSFVVIFLAAVLMLSMRGSDAATTMHKVLYFVCFAAFYAGLGGWLAIAPTATAQYFGTKYSARNYGIVFLAYGVGALVATFIGGYAKSIFKGSLLDAFIPIAILAVVGFLLAAFVLKPPKKVAEAVQKAPASAKAK
ncbi:MAG: OFA family MFS transporter [Chloroflexi bacterium]|nr:OFA family MFS transporter [Chloroflexota bacterium]